MSDITIPVTRQANIKQSPIQAKSLILWVHHSFQTKWWWASYCGWVKQGIGLNVCKSLKKHQYLKVCNFSVNFVICFCICCSFLFPTCFHLKKATTSLYKMRQNIMTLQMISGMKSQVCTTFVSIVIVLHFKINNFNMYVSYVKVLSSN